MSGRARFAWVPDIERGAWLSPMRDERFGSMHSVIPRGFEAYARIFHRIERDRPRETNTWLGINPVTYFDYVDDIEAALETERTTWAQAAASFGTTMHAAAQYPRLVRRDYGDSDGAIAPDGWRYGSTQEGSLGSGVLAAASAVLARHTRTPDAGIAAIWEGWGGLISSAGYSEFRLVATGDTGMRARLAMLGRRGAEWLRGWRMAARSTFGPAPKPGSGLLPRDVAVGPRLELDEGTGRPFILFEAGARDFAEESWVNEAPWVHNAHWPQSPSILWPDDHAWVLATEIDYDSTLVGGSTALIRELVQAPGVEALPLRPDADLSWDGDDINRAE